MIEELDIIIKAIEKFNYDRSIYVGKHKKQHKVDSKRLLEAIFHHLKEETSQSYNWKHEHEVEWWEGKERIDILSENTDNEYNVVIELDAHRADQVSKKFVSRMAMFLDKKVIYISLCYTGTAKMNVKECDKYFGYCAKLAEQLPNTLFFGKIFE